MDDVQLSDVKAVAVTDTLRLRDFPRWVFLLK